MSNMQITPDDLKEVCSDRFSRSAPWVWLDGSIIYSNIVGASVYVQCPVCALRDTPSQPHCRSDLYFVVICQHKITYRDKPAGIAWLGDCHKCRTVLWNYSANFTVPNFLVDDLAVAVDELESSGCNPKLIKFLRSVC